MGGTDFEGCETLLAHEIKNEIIRQRKLGNLTGLSSDDTAFIEGAVELRGNKLANGLRRLTQLLYECSGRKVLLLIDEYDTPLSSLTSLDDCLKVGMKTIQC